MFKPSHTSSSLVLQETPFCLYTYGNINIHAIASQIKSFLIIFYYYIHTYLFQTNQETSSLPMASTTEKPVDPEYTSEPPPPPPPATTGIDYFQVDVALRVLLFASSLVAVVVIVTSQQTELFPSISPLGPSVPKPAKFKNYPAFM